MRNSISRIVAVAISLFMIFQLFPTYFAFAEGSTKGIIVDDYNDMRQSATDGQVSLEMIPEDGAGDSAESLVQQDYEYVDTEEGIIITKYLGEDTDLFIPETINGKEVICIGENAFADSECILNIDLPSKLERIEARAFYNCVNIETVVIPESVKDIGRMAFGGCESLSFVEVLSDDCNVAEDAFIDCPKLEMMETEQENKEDNNEPEAALNDSNIEEIELPKAKLQFKGAMLTQRASNDYEYTVNNDGTIKITKYKGSASSLILPDIIEGKVVSEIGDSAFLGCNNLKTISLPSGLKKIGSNAFRESGLSNITLPQGLETIGFLVFADTNITEVRIPNSLKNAYDIAGDGPFGGDKIKSIIFENGIQSIPSNVCRGCKALTSVTIPDSVTEVKDSAFWGCNNLKTISLPSGLKKIGSNAFRESGLSNITLPQGLETIGFLVFADTNITEVRIPNSLKNAYDIAGDGPFGGDKIKSIIFENGIQSIPSNVCRGCKALTSVTIPDSVTEVKDYAFAGCSSLADVNIFSKNTYINNSSFSDCPKLKLYCDYHSLAVIYAINKDIPFYSLPQSNTTTNGVLNFANSSYYLNSKSVTASGAMRFHASYGIKPSMAGRISDTKIVLYVSKNTEFSEDSLKINGESNSNYTYNNNTRQIEIPVSNKDSKADFSFDAIEQYRDYIKSYAYLSYVINGQRKYEVINAINEKFSDISITAPDITNKKEVIVNGVGPASKSIDLYLSGTKVVTVTSKKNGSWSGAVTLSNPMDYYSYIITAKTVNEYAEEVEASTNVMYQGDAPEIKSVVMGYTEHGKNKSQEIYATNGKKPVLYYQPHSSFSYEVTLENNSTVDKVYVTSTRNNIKREMEATYSASTGKYVASGYFDENDHGYVPGSIGVEYTTKTQKIDDSLQNSIMSAAQQVANDTGLEAKNRTGSDHTASAAFDLSYLAKGANKTILNASTEYYKNITKTDLMDCMDLPKDIFDVAPYYIPGLDDSKYIFDIDNHEGKDVTLTVLEFTDDSLGLIKTATKLNLSTADKKRWLDTFTRDNIGYASYTIDAAYKMYKVRSEYDSLIKEINESSNIKDKAGAKKLAGELRDDKLIFTAAMIILPMMVAGGPMMGATAVFSGMIIMMKACGDMFFDQRERSILLGRGSYQLVIDPSGYIYDVCTNERLEDVTVSAYCILHDGSDGFWNSSPGDKQYGTLWGAVDYEQDNPLMTNSEGKYQWDVPEGWWRVKAEKEGYYSVWSDWMPVPPIQTDVNLGMVPIGGDISNMNVSLSSNIYTYDGTPKMPSVVVKYGNYTLTPATDYSVAYSNNINVGTATVTITGKGNYTGTITKSFKISAAPNTGSGSGTGAKTDSGGSGSGAGIKNGSVNSGSGAGTKTGSVSSGSGAGTSTGSSGTQQTADRAKQAAADGTALGAGASAEAAEAAITTSSSEEGPAGSRFAPLLMRSSKQGKSNIKLTWNRVRGATKYVVYGNACGKKNKMKKLATVSGKTFNVKKISKKLKKGTYHKFIVVALNSSNNVVSSSKVIHVATKGGKVGNSKSVTVSKKVIAKAKKLKKGKSLKLNAKAVAASKKLKVKKHRAVCYESTDTKIATVDKKGRIKARKKGTCYVYAYAQNGIYRKVKVTVK